MNLPLGRSGTLASGGNGASDMISVFLGSQALMVVKNSMGSIIRSIEKIARILFPQTERVLVHSRDSFLPCAEGGTNGC